MMINDASGILVNTFDGGLLYPVPILSLPDQGIPLQFTLKYSSKWTNYNDEGFGNGWSHNYSIFYRFDENGNIAVYRNAQKDEFVNVDSYFAAPRSVYDTLFEHSPGKYLLTTKHGIKYYFNSPIHRHISVIEDKNGNTLSFSYNSNMQLISVHGNSGNKLRITYSENQVKNITYPYSREFSFSYDEQGNLTEITNPLDDVVRFGYHDSHLLSEITDAMGKVVHIIYSDNRVSQISNSGLNARDFSYNPEALTTSMTFSGEFKYKYNADSTIDYIEDPNGNKALYTWDSNHNLLSYTDQNGNTQAFTYDNHGNLTSFSDANGNKEFYYYDNPYNLLTRLVNKGGLEYSYEYDNYGNLVQVSLPDNTIIKSVYDSHGNMLMSIDGNGDTIQYSYNRLGRIDRIIFPIGDIQLSYDSVGNMVSLTNPLGNSTLFTYNQLNRLITETDPLGNTISYSYNKNGKVISRTDGKGNTTNYFWNAQSQLTQRSVAGSGSYFKYDNYGNLRTASNDNIALHYEYDSLNRLVKKEYPAWNKSIIYSYDLASNLISMTDADNGITTYEYDNIDRLISLTNPEGISVDFQYDNLDRLTRQDNENGTYSLYSYDNIGNLINLSTYSSTSLMEEYIYSYDNMGNRLSISDTEGLNLYTYNGNSELISANYSDGSFENFTYDNHGNRILYESTYDTVNSVFNDGDQLISKNLATYGYDENGNLISKTIVGETTQYVYDTENRLEEIIYSDGQTNEYKYGPFGLRISVIHKVGTESRFVYDGENVLHELDNSGSSIVRYTTGLGIDTWFVMEKGGQSYYYHKDGLGSITAITDNGMNISNSYQYNAFGEVRSSTEQIENPYQFTGRRYDVESGLFYYRARYYDADNGRFTQQDPIKRLNSNLYIYVKNNPTYYVDPMGLQAVVGPGYYRMRVPSFIPKSPQTGSTAKYTSEETQNKERKNPDIIEGPPDLPLSPDLEQSGVLYPPEPAPPPYDWTIPDPSPSPPPSGGGDDSGVESHRLNKDASLFLKGLPKLQKESVKSGFLEPEKNLESRPNSSQNVTYSESSSSTLPTLIDIIPFSGIENSSIEYVTPKDVQVGTDNVNSSTAVNFINDQTSQVQAVALGVHTLDSVYNHDYSTCNRFHNYTLESASAEPFLGLSTSTSDTLWFWNLTTTKDTLIENAYVFVVFVHESERKFTVDSRWLSDQYPTSEMFEYDHVFNLQLWSSSANNAFNLLKQCIRNLDNYDPSWSVVYSNTDEPVQPTVLLKSANLLGSVVEMEVHSWLNSALSVEFSGTYRSVRDYRTDVPFSQEISILPGYNKITLPLGELIDAVILTNVNGFIDKLYVGAGFWFAFDDQGAGGSSEVRLYTPGCEDSPSLSKTDFNLPGCAIMSGAVGNNGYIGIGRTLNPNGLPIDVSRQKSLSFEARGDGRSYRLLLETDRVEKAGSTDYHHVIFTTSSDWKVYNIPFSSLKQSNTPLESQIPFDASDLKTIVWTSTGAPVDATFEIDSMYLDIRKIKFSDNIQIKTVSGPKDTSDIDNPYLVSANISGQSNIDYVYLNYSNDFGLTFKAVQMEGTDSIFVGAIPPQPLSTSVYYYIEAVGTDSSVAFYPISSPKDLLSFQISSHPFLLIDDFSDTEPKNPFGDQEVLFSSGSEPKIHLYHDANSMSLKYDVTETDSYAGYVSSFPTLDLSSYDQVGFRTKVSSGNGIYKFGLKDKDNNEHKVIVNEYLYEGIDTTWNKIQIPLDVFINKTNLEEIVSLVIVFENAIGSDAGRIEIDDLMFEYYDVHPIVLDNFNTPVFQNGVGGHNVNFTSSGAGINISYDSDSHAGITGSSQKIEYSDISGSEWAVSVYNLGDLRISDYDFLQFIIKGSSGNEKPNIYLKSDSEGEIVSKMVDIENYTQVETEWKIVKIPLLDFESQGIDLNHCAELIFAFEWEEMNGTIFLEDVFFIQNIIAHNLRDSTYCFGEEVNLCADIEAYGYSWYEASANKHINDSKCMDIHDNGQYYLVVNTASGYNFSSDSVIIDFYAQLEKPVLNLTDHLVLCEGDGEELRIHQDGYGYLWSTQDTTRNIMVVDSGKYHAFLIDSHGCTSVSSDTVNVDFSLLPISNFEYTSKGLQLALINTSENADYYYWDFGDNSTSKEVNPIHEYSEFGIYTLRLIAFSDSCGNDTTTMVINIPTTITERLNSTCKIYPNPATNELYIDFQNKQISKIEIKLLNNMGRLIFHEVIQNYTGQYKMILDSFEKGIYIIQINYEGNVFSKRITIL